MPNTVVLHVGPHKTGTTALQQAFSENADLLARYGICYPRTGRKQVAHQNLAIACRRDGDGSLLADLKAEIQQEKKVFLSSELFAGLEVTSLEDLAGVFGDADVQIVYALRRLPALWPSHWKEMVKHGQDMSFQEYLNNVTIREQNHYISPPLPTRQLGNFEKVFGRDALRLIVYDARNRSSGNYGSEFVDDFFGIGQDAWRFATSKLNITPPDWQAELGRQFNILARGKLRYQEKWKLRHRLIQILDNEPPRWIEDFRDVFDAAESMTISDQSTLIAAEQARVVRQYGDLFLDPVDTYFAPIEVQVTVLEDEDFDPEMRRSIRLLYDRLVQQE